MVESRDKISTVEGLETLPIGSVVLDRNEDAWLRDDPKRWIAAETSFMSSERILRYGPFTVIYVPRRRSDD